MYFVIVSARSLSDCMYFVLGSVLGPLAWLEEAFSRRGSFGGAGPAFLGHVGVLPGARCRGGRVR